MEIVQKIKDAEKKSKEIIEKAKTEGTLKYEKMVKHYEQETESAQRQRTEMIQKAVLSAEKAGTIQADTFNSDIAKQIESLIKRTNEKIAICAGKVVEKTRSI